MSVHEVPPPQHAIPGSYLLQVLQSGLLPDALMSAAESLLRSGQISLADLSRPDMRLPVQLLDIWLQQSRLPLATTAISCGSQVRLTSQGPLSLILMTAATAREGLTLAARYMPLLSTALQVELQEADDRASFFVTPKTGLPAMDQFIIYALAAIVRKLCADASGQVMPAVMHVAGPLPPDLAADPGFRPSDWQFDAPANALVFPASYLDTPGLLAEPVALASAAAHCEQALAALPVRDGTIEQVRRLLRDAEEGFPDLDRVASTLHRSRSTLKRNLADAGTRFSQLLEEARRQRALRLLGQPGLSLVEIADQLGYSDVSNFCHAFKRWTGRTPADFRAG